MAMYSGHAMRSWLCVAVLLMATGTPALSIGGLSQEPAGDSSRIRLVNGSSAREGRVEIYREGQWGTVCDDFWDVRDATVACRQLGLDTQVKAFGVARFGEGTVPRIWLEERECDGTEALLADCPSRDMGGTFCDHSEDAGVSCGTVSSEGESSRIRLVNGTNAWEGRVEIFEGGEWGTVCDDHWDVRDATVACRQLGLDTNQAKAFGASQFGQGALPRIWLDDLECMGSESRLTACMAPALGENDCFDFFSEVAGLSCEPPSPGGESSRIRLVDGNNPWEGRVEIYEAGEWGTVCDINWNDLDAQVACRQLGLNTSHAKAYHASSRFGRSSLTRVWLDDVRCTGTESRLTGCPAMALGDHGCWGGRRHAGLSCEPLSPLTG